MVAATTGPATNRDGAPLAALPRRRGMAARIAIAGAITGCVIVLTQIICYAVWHDLPGGYDPAIVVMGSVIPLLTCFPICLTFLNQQERLRLALLALEAAHRSLKEQSGRDAATGLLHRQAFFESLAKRRRASDSGVFIMIDIDNFKSINDSFGHLEGDRALSLVAGALLASTRESDLVGRYGGEEFCVFCPGSDLDTGMKIAERIRCSVEAIDFCPRGDPQGLTVSVGVSPGGHNSIEAMIEAADAALYDAKRMGRNQVMCGVARSYLAVAAPSIEFDGHDGLTAKAAARG